MSVGTSTSDVLTPQTTPDDAILYEKAGGIARIRINRPGQRNALNPPMFESIWASLYDAEADADVGVIILSGEGSCFCAGADLKWLVNEPPIDAEAFISERSQKSFVKAKSRSLEVWDQLWEIPKPVVSSVHGYCLASGCEIAFYSDFTIASDDAIFGEPESKNGWCPASLWLLSPKLARAFFLLGELVPAAEALRMGMINRVVPRADLAEETELVAQQLLALPPGRAAAVKRTGLRFYRSMGFDFALQAAGEASVYTRALQGFADDEIGFYRETKERGLRSALNRRDANKGDLRG